DRVERRSFQEAWSCLTVKGYTVVARLLAGPSGGYFSHARLARADEEPSFDPGAWLGLSHAFDSPGAAFGTTPAPFGEMPWTSLRRERPEQAASFAAHLHDACLANTTLIVPTDDYPNANPLALVLAFARASLPKQLRMKCAVRIYTRKPADFRSDIHV